MLCEQALALPKEDRDFLLRRLLDSLEVESDFDQKPLTPEWDAELRRRAEEIDNGTVATIPAEQVHAQVRDILRDARRVSS